MELMKMDDKTGTDLIQVLVNLHDRIGALQAEIRGLRLAVEGMPKASPPAISRVGSGRAAWSVAAEKFLRSPEARKLARDRQLTAEVIAQRAGLAERSAGRNKRIGQLARAAGFQSVVLDGAPAIYVPRPREEPAAAR